MSESEKPKRGARPGNKNAAKKRGAKTAWLQVRCAPEDLERWRADAAAAGVSLMAWVRGRLDS